MDTTPAPQHLLPLLLLTSQHTKKETLCDPHIFSKVRYTNKGLSGLFARALHPLLSLVQSHSHAPFVWLEESTNPQPMQHNMSTTEQTKGRVLSLKKIQSRSCRREGRGERRNNGRQKGLFWIPDRCAFPSLV